MGRRTDPVCRLCRRAREKLYLKGERCYSPKCPISRQAPPPGQHGLRVSKKASEYGIRLVEKQKARHVYGLTERQFRGYFEKALKSRGQTGEELLVFLERRLDNVLYRLGFSTSRAGARLLVRHGHVLINGKTVDIPSYQTATNEVITADAKTGDKLRGKKEMLAERKTPSWLSLDVDQLAARVLRPPVRQEIDTLLKESLIVEFYSR